MVDRLPGDVELMIGDHLNLQRRARPEYRRLDAYYDGIHRLEQLQLAIPTELEQFVVFVNWCRKSVDSVENRLDINGFRLPGTSDLDDRMQEVWTYNDMQREVTMAWLDALSLSVSYITVGSNDEDPEFPLITVESPHEMSHMRNARTRKLDSAFKSYNPDEGGQDQSGTLYLPNETVWVERDGSGRWYIGDYDFHGMGRVPVVAMVNRMRTHQDRNWRLPGTSQMHDVIPIVDAAARALTNAQVAQETHAVPQRGVLGATKGDFVDEKGNPIPAWESYFGAVWALGNEKAKTFQFDSSDMKNFETIVNLYARQASGVTGLPPNYFGLVSDDAASDSAIRSRETQLVKFAEREQQNFGSDIRQVMQIEERVRTGEWSDDYRALEVLWQDAGTPTRGQVTDAAVKLKEADVLTREDVWEELNYSPARIEKLKKRFAERDASLQVQGVNQLLANQGLDENGVPVGADSGGPRTGVVPTAPIPQ